MTVLVSSVNAADKFSFLQGLFSMFIVTLDKYNKWENKQSKTKSI